ncbi:MAG: SET domain-containing protein [Methanotrichaceae archaeon]|nr:SET domain-containing protein [Methanotrichaceae archaeon]
MYLMKTYINESSIEGNGIFAEDAIPRGTIVYFYSREDEFLSRDELESLPKDKKDQIQKYGVEDEFGNWRLTGLWNSRVDVNHSCDANILSLWVEGMYCDIAVKNIKADEEITVDYRIFFSSFPWSMKCKCNSSLCCGLVGSGFKVDYETQELWYNRLSQAVKDLYKLYQPLFYSEDGNAKQLTKAIISKKEPQLFPFIKFSLISNRQYN